MKFAKRVDLKRSYNHKKRRKEAREGGREGHMEGGEKEGRNWYLCWVMDMLISLIAVILQCICTSKHQIVKLKYTFFILSVVSH